LGSSETPAKTALAVGAHPDDIEFMSAGTLLLLKQAGYDIHMWSVANGCCGTRDLDRDEIVELRARESADSAREAGATLHAPVTDDMEVLYRPDLVARAASLVRRVRPEIILLPAPDDYMEDHANTSRVVVAGAFARGMPNFHSEPPAEPWYGEVTLYHAMPHGLTDGLGGVVRPGWYVDVGPVLEQKARMLACHASQGRWLSASQAPGSPVDTMKEMCERAGRMSGAFEFAEGFRRHSHLGYCEPGADPLARELGDRCLVDDEYLRTLGSG